MIGDLVRTESEASGQSMAAVIVNTMVDMPVLDVIVLSSVEHSARERIYRQLSKDAET